MLGCSKAWAVKGGGGEAAGAAKAAAMIAARASALAGRRRIDEGKAEVARRAPPRVESCEAVGGRQGGGGGDGLSSNIEMFLQSNWLSELEYVSSRPESCNGNSQSVRKLCLRAPLKTVRDSNKRASYALKKLSAPDRMLVWGKVDTSLLQM